MLSKRIELHQKHGAPEATTHTSSGCGTTTAAAVVVEVSLQHFIDYVWIIVRDVDSATHGIIALGQADGVLMMGANGNDDAGHAPHAGGDVRGRSDGVEEADSWRSSQGTGANVEVDVLLGDRDDPLSNVTQEAITRAVVSSGDPRPVLMCLSLQQTVKQLSTSAMRREFVTRCCAAVVELLQSASS